MSLRTEVPRLRSLPWFTTWLWRPSRRRRRRPADDGLLLRRPIFRKYFLALFAAVIVPLLINGASEAWFGYQDQRTMLDARLLVEASAAAARIQGFLDGIRSQMQWAVAPDRAAAAHQSGGSSTPASVHGSWGALRAARSVPGAR